MSEIAPEAVAEVCPRKAVPLLERRWLCRAALTLAVLFAVLSALPTLAAPPGRDQGTYLTIGQSLLHGKVLYRDIWDNKPPAIFFFYAGVVRVFGRALWSVGATDILCFWLICGLMYRLLRRPLGTVGAAASVLVYSCWHARLPYYWMLQPEVLQAAALLCAFLLLRDRGGRRWQLRFAAAGVLLAFGFLLKYTFAVAILLALPLPWLRIEERTGAPRFRFTAGWREAFSRLAVLTAAMLSILVAAFGWLVARGAWPAMREAQFVVLPRYAVIGMQYEPNFLFYGVWRMILALLPINLAAFGVLLVVAWRRRELNRVLVVVLAFVAILASAAVQLRCHTYYFQGCFPLLAATWGYLFVCGLGWAEELAGWLRRRGLRLGATLLWVAVANLLFLPFPSEFSRLVLRYDGFRLWCRAPEQYYAGLPGALPMELLDGQMKVLRFLGENAMPSDTIFLWGSNSLLYFASGHEPPTRFPLNLGLMSKWAQPAWLPEVAAEVRRVRPRYILVTRHDELWGLTYINDDSEQFLAHFPELNGFIAEHYAVAQELKDFRIYRWKE